MDVFLDQPCQMCRSRKWCGRQCANRPKGARASPQPTPPPSPPRPAAPTPLPATPPAPPPGKPTHQAELASHKTRIGIRLDDDLITALKATGPGWQTRINQILRAAVLP